MPDESSKGNLGARIVIIIYALGIVAIGAYPIHKQYGGIYEFLKVKTKAFASTDSAKGFFDNVKSYKLPKKQASRPSFAPPVEKPMDKLSGNDRKELESLIDKL